MKYSFVKKLRNIATTTMQKSNITIFLQKYLMQIRVAQCVKNVRTRSFSGLCFSLCIQSKCGKMRTRKTPNTNTFHAVEDTHLDPTDHL